MSDIDELERMLLNQSTSDEAKIMIDEMHEEKFGLVGKSYRAKIFDLRTQELVDRYRMSEHNVASDLNRSIHYWDSYNAADAMADPSLYLEGVVNAIIPEVNNGIRAGLIAPDYDIMTNIYTHLSDLVSKGVLTLDLVHQYFPDLDPQDYNGLDSSRPLVIWPGGVRRRVSIFTIFGYNEDYGYNINNLLTAIRQYVTDSEYQLLRLSVGSGPGQAEHTQYPELMSHKAPKKQLLKLRGPRS